MTSLFYVVRQRFYLYAQNNDIIKNMFHEWKDAWNKMGTARKKTILEQELYAPVRDFLIENGYEVKAEVGYCDVTAFKEEQFLVVEMKTTLNLDVILQAVQRQRMADVVYIAVPKKGKVLYTKRWKNICHLLRRLEIGLLLVSIRGEHAIVEEALKPEPFNRKISRGTAGMKKGLIIKEFSRRHGDYNVGGSTRTKLVTAYREMAIHIAGLIEKHGPLSIKALKCMGTDSNKTAGILQNNHYGWFQRISRGMYDLTDAGREELKKYRELVDFYVNK